MSTVIDEELSAVVVAWIGRSHRPLSEDRVRSQLGEAALRLLPRAQAIFADLDRAEPAPWRHREITDVAAAARSFLRATHPELSEAAVEAVVNSYTFSWR